MATTDPVPVWPHKNGTVRGVAFYPLYPSVPEAASRSFVDALPGHLPGDVASQERLLELLGKLDLIAHCA